MSRSRFILQQSKMTGESSRAIYRQANEDQILRSYGYHTESNELAIADIKSAARRKSSRP